MEFELFLNHGEIFCVCFYCCRIFLCFFLDFKTQEEMKKYLEEEWLHLQNQVSNSDI
jgi:hypothetical protein